MAGFWNMLREEVLGTVDDIRQKGAIGALRDAALDTKDLALDAGGWLVDGVKGIVASDEAEGDMPQAYVVGPDVPKRGSTCMLQLPDGNLVEATAVDVDGVSEPPRVRVTAAGLEEPLLVPVLDPATAEAAREARQNAGGANTIGGTGMSVIQGFKQELNLTVQEFREKGAVGAMKDAALDAVDMVGSTAKTAVDGARSLAEPVAQDFREKGAVGAVKDAALDAVDIIGSTAKTAVNGAQTLATPLIDLLDLSDPDPAQQAKQPGAEGSPAAATDSSAAAPAPAAADGADDSTTLLGGLKQEWRNTVQDFRDKGAVGAVKDAAMDAVDLVGSTATTALGAANTATTTAMGAASTAIKGARARAAPLIEQVSGGLPDLWSDASVSASSSQPTAEGAAPQHAESGAPAPAAPASAGAPAVPKLFVPPPRSPGSAEASGSPKPHISEIFTPRCGDASPQASGDAASKAKEPVPESAMPGGASGKKSLVSMRRGMFEKPKQQDEAKNEAEELID